ncbi:MAG: hypothetical protein WAT20_07785 [Ferruginibacter sp.]|nr:hypothetical protein [Chitinophagaceae bacterium]
MTQQTETKPTERNINKPAYAVFLLAGIYFLFQRDFSQVVTFWGLALMFDPFNTETPFKKRPFYQQAWLIVHLSVTLAAIVLMLLGK